MIDLDELIAEAREQAAYLRGVSRDGSMPYSGELLESLADALESVRAEREAALARIAELEAELEVAMRPHSECERSGAEAGERIVDLEGDLAGAEARIAEAAKLHRPFEGVHGEMVCAHRYCVDGAMDQHKWPCPTAVALGLNEGENEK